MASNHELLSTVPLHEQLTKKRRRQILIAVAIGTFMGPLDSSVVNIALPSIRSTFDVSFTTVEWVVMSYLLIISSLLLTFGRLGDLYGHKRIYMAGFVVFTTGSLLCALAPTVYLLIVFRALQAVGAGMLMAMGPAIVTDITPPRERGKSLGIIAVSVSIALTAGPVIGGLLTAKLGWPSIFYINVPVGVLALFLAYRVLPDNKDREAQPFDIWGALMLFAALVCLLFPLSYAEKIGWQNPMIIGLLLVGVALLTGFVFLESSIKNPMIDLTIFRNRLFAMANLSAFLSYIAMFSAVLIMPFYLQQLRGMSPSQAGLMLIPMPLTTMIIAPISGAISDRVDTRYVSSLGMGITALGFWMLSNLHVNSSTLGIVFSFVVVGFGSAMFQTPNNSAVMGGVPPNRRGIAAGLLASMRNVGMVLGVAISGAVFSSRLAYLNKTLATKGLIGDQLHVQAFTGAMHLTFVIAAAIAAVAVLTSLVRGPMDSTLESRRK